MKSSFDTHNLTKGSSGTYRVYPAALGCGPRVDLLGELGCFVSGLLCHMEWHLKGTCVDLLLTRERSFCAMET